VLMADGAIRILLVLCGLAVPVQIKLYVLVNIEIQ